VIIEPEKSVKDVNNAASIIINLRDAEMSHILIKVFP
jgi:hypothetical protein